MNLGIWEDFTSKIKSHIENDNMDNFYHWDVIQHTMIANVHQTEVNLLMRYWENWQDKLQEDILKPNRHHQLDYSSTNNLHHAYSLQILMNETGVQLNEFGDIIEFGGGYGNTCRLIKKYGHKDMYYIYDIPELIKLQEHYLNRNSVTGRTMLSEDSKVKFVYKPALFLGLWSLTEVPLTERQRLLTNLDFHRADYIFLGMADKFVDDDNIQWLNNSIIPSLPNHDCKIIPIEHMPGMSYFIAKRK